MDDERRLAAATTRLKHVALHERRETASAKALHFYHVARIIIISFIRHISPKERINIYPKTFVIIRSVLLCVPACPIKTFMRTLFSGYVFLLLS